MGMGWDLALFTILRRVVLVTFKDRTESPLTLVGALTLSSFG